MNTGWHFTTKALWEGHIRREGLVPYPIPHPDIRKAVEEVMRPAMAVWLWPRRPEGLNLLGCALDRAMCYGTPEVVLLEADYPPQDDLRGRHRLHHWNFTHLGSYTHERAKNGPWVYHEAEPFVLVVSPIPPERVRLVADLDLVSLVEAATPWGMEARRGRQAR